MSSKRDAILKAALTCFVEQGFYGTAIPKIATGAQVGAGTIYRYFEHKEALVNAVYQNAKTLLIAALLDEFPESAPARQQFAELWRRLAAFAQSEPEALVFLELHHHQPYLSDESRAIELAALEPIVAFFLRAAQAGAVKDAPPEVLISMVWGAFVGLIKSQRLGHLTLTPEVVATSEACCWDMLTPHPTGGLL